MCFWNLKCFGLTAWSAKFTTKSWWSRAEHQWNHPIKEKFLTMFIISQLFYISTPILSKSKYTCTSPAPQPHPNHHPHGNIFTPPWGSDTLLWPTVKLFHLDNYILRRMNTLLLWGVKWPTHGIFLESDVFRSKFLKIFGHQSKNFDTHLEEEVHMNKKSFWTMIQDENLTIHAKWTCFNSLRPSDAIWRQRSGSTLAQVMTCCLTAPSHYLNQCWLIIIKV